MNDARRFPLLAKVLGWLILHLLILGLSFFLFVRWQLGMGLDSLLSGSAGERLESFGDTVVGRIAGKPTWQWSGEIKTLADQKHVIAGVYDPTGFVVFPAPVPPNVAERARTSVPPQRRDPGPPPGARGRPPRPDFDPLDDRPPPPGPDDEEEDGPPPREDGPRSIQNAGESLFIPKSKPAFLMRAQNGDGYWAGVVLHPPSGRGGGRQPVLLLLRSDRLDGSGMFFDFKPWLLGGLAVLFLSLAFWTPFVWGITRYIRRLTAATDRIALGDFQVSLPPRGNDELGNLGQTIETMASRLDHLVTGQKRFLGDAAHELCAPIARIRTGLGILEMKLTGADSSAISSIEADTAELAALVNEILAFSRAGNRSPTLQEVEIAPLVQGVVSREAVDVEVETAVPAGLTLKADPTLLGRAIGNLVRNAAVHAGSGSKVRIDAVETKDATSISVTDNGPGVPADELPRIFEPFYRVDRSRSRDTGGSGLGLAIVRTCVETCGGIVSASLPETGGFCVTLRFPKTAGTAP